MEITRGRFSKTDYKLGIEIYKDEKVRAKCSK